MADIIITEKTDNIDFEEIQTLLNEAHKSNEKKGMLYATANQSADTLKQKVGDGKCLVALCDDQLAGTVTVSFRKLDYWYHCGDVAIIKLLGVLPQYKGCGISTKLIDACIALARENGVKVIVSDSAEKNVVVKNLFIKYGFKRVDYCKYAANNFYSAVYAKWLDNAPPKDWYCALRYNLKRVYIRLKYNSKTGRE